MKYTKGEQTIQMTDYISVFIVVYLAVINLTAVILTVHDKRASKKGTQRIRERTLLIAAAIGGAFAMSVTMRLIRHKTKHKRFMLGVPVMFVLQIVALYWFNTYTLRVTTLTIADTRIQDEITIVQLTDLHGAVFGRDNSRLISRIDSVSPDIIVITGDMSTRGADDNGVEVAMQLLSDLSEKYPVFVVDGGHDGYVRWEIAARRINAAFLDYETVNVTAGRTTIAVHGVPNRYFSASAAFDIREQFEVDRSIYNVLIAHEARFRAYSDLGADLSLVGHTHGGIVRLPVIGAVFHSQGFGRQWFPEFRNLQHLYGLLENGHSKLFVSSGLGLHPVPLRFYNRPEIAVIRLVPQ
jgi:hypothetical protein